MDDTSTKADLVDGRYRRLDRLGSGSMGVVYRAEDVFLQRPVAIKLIDPSLASDPVTVERFVKEARALAQIRHDNVVQVYAFGRHASSYYFAMEYIAGDNVDVLVEATRERGAVLDLDLVMNIARAIGSGLDAVHAQKLVHRDVKPSNIVIEAQTGRPVLIDFGLARRRSGTDPKISETAGTPFYMAPEQASDPEGDLVTHRSDVYAFACTMFELLTNHTVFEGDVADVIVAQLTAPPRPVSSLMPDLARLDPPLLRAMSKEPAQRHASAGALVAEIEAAISAVKRARSSMKSIAASGPDEGILVLAEDSAMRRRIGGAIERAIQGAFRTPRITYVDDADAFVAAFERAPVRIVLIDEERASGSPTGEDAGASLAPLVDRIRACRDGSAAAVVVLSRSWQERGHVPALRNVDILPKPVNLKLLESAMQRVVARSIAPPSG